MPPDGWLDMLPGSGDAETALCRLSSSVSSRASEEPIKHENTARCMVYIYIYIYRVHYQLEHSNIQFA